MWRPSGVLVVSLVPVTALAQKEFSLTFGDKPDQWTGGWKIPLVARMGEWGLGVTNPVKLAAYLLFLMIYSGILYKGYNGYII